MDRYDVSFVAWAASNKNETAALISSNCSKLSDWSDDELSAPPTPGAGHRNRLL